MPGQSPRLGAGNGNSFLYPDKREAAWPCNHGHDVRAKTGQSNLYKHNKNIIMNKAGIVDAVHAVLGGTKVQAEQVVETVLNSIIESLKKGEEVSIAGLGIFSVKMRAAREARNPRTGEAIQVAAMKVPKFRAAKALKDAVK
jgi:DNA-binding protein HU-beta